MSKNNDKFIDELRTDLDGPFEDDELKELGEDLDNKIILNDENGEEVPFEFLDLIEYESKEYVVLLPTDDEDGEVVILEIEETDGDEESYVSVDDEETLIKVFEIFKEKFKDEFNFVD